MERVHYRCPVRQMEYPALGKIYTMLMFRIHAFSSVSMEYTLVREIVKRKVCHTRFIVVYFFNRLFLLLVSTKQIVVKICIWQLKTPWIVRPGLESGRAALCKWATYSYASDLPFKNFCKLAKQAETIRNYQKQVLVMINHCLWNSQINSTPE